MTKRKRVEARRERRVFSAEFKVEAVRLMQERQAVGVSLAQIGRELDVRPDVLRRWARQEARGRERLPGDGTAVSGEAEVRRLQRENAVLRQERDFLKKAAASSTGQGNTSVKLFSWCLKSQRLSWSLI
jgi:transposase